MLRSVLVFTDDKLRIIGKGLQMGFRVDEKRIVHLEPDTNEFGDTRIEKNPTSTQTHCAQYPLIVHSLILRRAGKRTNKAIGDNCPLIYALKGRDGLSVTYSSVKPMIRLFNCMFRMNPNTHFGSIRSPISV